MVIKWHLKTLYFMPKLQMAVSSKLTGLNSNYKVPFVLICIQTGVIMFNISQIDHKLILNLSFTSYNLSSLMSYEACALCTVHIQIIHCNHQRRIQSKNFDKYVCTMYI